MTDEEKARELTIKNVTDGKNKYFSWGFYKGCVVGLKYNNKQIAELKEKLNIRSCQNCRKYNRTCPNDGSCKNYSKWEGYKNPQLTKAKEIIKKFSEFVNNEVEFDPEHPQEHTDLWIELCEKAEQFLNSEVEE